MKTITVAGGNLFQIAAQYLGDATQWIRIAQLNKAKLSGGNDPQLSGVVTLIIPDVDPTAGGGVPTQ
jgi:nucleoid-associated protein YgaU